MNLAASGGVAEEHRPVDDGAREATTARAQLSPDGRRPACSNAKQRRPVFSAIVAFLEKQLEPGAP